MNNPTFTEIFTPLLNEAKEILPTCQNATAAPGSGVDPQRTAAFLQKLISDLERALVIATAPNTAGAPGTAPEDKTEIPEAEADATEDSQLVDAPKAKQFALVLVENTTELERNAFADWLNSLIVIRQESGSKWQKARRSIQLTLRSQVVWPTVRLLARELKRNAWDDRKPATRFAAAGALGGALAFGSQGAGIAALGTAIGVPLWIVTGAGAAFAGAVLEELRAAATRK